jgi:ArsR family transcriptional regulator
MDHLLGLASRIMTRSHEIDDHRWPSSIVDPGDCQNAPVASVVDLAETCPPLLQEALSEDEAERLAAALKVVADPARLRLLSLIQAQPDGEACTCHLTDPLGLSQPTVSHHLKVLHDAGLLEREKRGSWVYYRVVPEGLALLSEVLR